MIYDAAWALAKCEEYQMTVNWNLRTVKSPSFTRYWTWGCEDNDTMIEAVVEAVAYIEKWNE